MPRIVSLGLLLICSAIPVSGQVQLEWEVGAIDGAQHELWQRLEDAAIVGDHVLAIDISQGIARVFDLEGRFVRLAGRAGQGPGEFARPSDIWFDSAHVYISDFAQGRVVVMNHDFRPVDTARELYIGLRGLSAVAPLDHGWRFGLAGVVWSSNDQTMLAYPVLWRNDEPVDTLSSFETNHVRQIFENDPDRRHSVWRSTGPDESWTVVGPGRLAQYVAPSLLRIYDVAKEGPRIAREIQLPGARRPVRRSEIDRWSDWRLDTYGEPSHPSGSAVATSYEFPEDWNPWARLESDPRGNLYLLRSGLGSLEPAMSTQTWVRYLPDGTAAGEVELPRGVNVLRFDRDRLLAVRHDEFQVEYLQMYRISW